MPVSTYQSNLVAACLRHEFLDSAFVCWLTVQKVRAAKPVLDLIPKELFRADVSLRLYLTTGYTELSALDRHTFGGVLQEFLGQVIPCAALLSRDFGEGFEVGTSEYGLLSSAANCLEDVMSDMDVSDFILCSDLGGLSRRQRNLLSSASLTYYLPGWLNACVVTLPVAGSVHMPIMLGNQVSLTELRARLEALCSDEAYVDLVAELTGEPGMEITSVFLYALAMDCFGPGPGYLEGMLKQGLLSVVGSYSPVFDWFWGVLSLVDSDEVRAGVTEAREVGCISVSNLIRLAGLYREYLSGGDAS